jgi:Peptidase family M1 domain
MRRIGFLVASVLFGTTLTAAVPEYQAIRAARPDGRVSIVSNLILERDVYRLEFRSGAFHFLAPANGKIFGAVFIGDGTYTLQPATAAEKRQLRLVTRDANLDVLTDRFDEMVLLFTDNTADEIEKQAPAKSAAVDPRAVSAYESYLDWQKKKVSTNLHLRVLEDMLNRPDRHDGVFLARVDGKKYAPALIAIDPLGISNLAAKFGSFSGDEVAFLSLDNESSGFWYLCTTARNAVNGRSRAIQPIADALNYDITTSIDGEQIDGTTVIRFTALEDGIRVLPINILPKLKIRSARLLTGSAPTELGIVQEEIDSSVFARLFQGEVADSDAAVVFPKSLNRNDTVEITLEYGGRGVLQAYADGFSVRARESWYPNLGTFTDVATYQMKFRYPKRNSLVAVGMLVDEKVDGGQRIATWKSDIPIRVAGFNYGTFEKISRHDDASGIDIEVYTNRSWTKKAEDTVADAMNATRTATAFFGRAPYPRVAVAQQIEWGFGQSWPTLVYLPTIALTTSAERVFGLELDPRGTYEINEFAKTVTWHEMAHQWWGHQVGWQTYRDQWLSEGFAEFTAALVLQFTESLRSYDKFWELRREHIFERRGSVSNDQAGPISQGYRLFTRSAPGAAQVTMYEKGAYVVHMLRMMMRDPTKKNPDETFMAMMKDFLNTYAGKNPSTADFQAVVERHMTPQMDMAGNHRMDYFFAQWVDGTEIPRFKNTLQVTASTSGKYRISGTITQENVSAGFRTLVPLYLDFGGDKLARLGQVRLMGQTPTTIDIEVPLPTAPRRVVVNALHDVLARD